MLKTLKNLFKQDKDVRILIATDAAGEGINLQRAHLMVNYDLPWNPMRIEQRIGRIDRRGQKSDTVKIYNMITDGTIDATVYERCLSKIGVFESSIGDCSEILGDISDQILKIMFDPELESCKDGDIPFVVQNTAPQVTFMKDTAVFDMPALFDSIDEVREHVDNPKFMKLMQQVYNDGGYELLGYADQGFRVMTTNKKIESLADFKGQKIRTMENSYHMAYWKALGASPTPMTFSEVYIGLQQGTIDAQENPYEVIVSNKLYEQQDYVVETNHLPHLISLIVSEEFMKELTDEQQQIIREAAETAKQYAREQSDERIASKIKTIEDSGTQIITLSDEVHEQIRKECQPIYESIEKNVSSDIVDAYLTQ